MLRHTLSRFLLERAKRFGLLALLALTTACASLGRGGSQAMGDGRPLPDQPEVFVDTAMGAYVLVDLDANLLRFIDRKQTVWQAPVGTGTGLRLQSEDGEWHFTTPRGVFQAVYKEELPVWHLPDWYFIEKNLPMPAEGSPERRLEGQLGVAAVYISQEIAIHGTDKPELLGQRVSHGCIRLENKFAQRLYHNVQIGTPIVIIGGEHLDDLPPGETTDPGVPRPRPPDPLAGLSTPDLLSRLERLLESNDRTGAWVPLTSRLITRGLKDDAPALRGLLSLAGAADNEVLDREYATFLADAFSRGSLRVVVSLSRIDEEARERATSAIVEATMSFFPTLVLEDSAPWPTRRLHQGVLGPEGRAGWEALLNAEREYRERALTLRSQSNGRVDARG